MGAPVAQMFEQMLDIVSGWVNGYSLEKSLLLDDDLLTGNTDVPAGRCAYIGNEGKFKLGPTGKAMPHFLWQGKEDPDVYNNGVSPVTATRHWIGISPTGKMRGLVATGGYEMQTTEYDKTKTYTPNQVLKSDANGKLTNDSVTLYTNLVVGVTSWMENQDNQASPATGPAGENAHGVNVLTFYSVYLPGSEATST